MSMFVYQINFICLQGVTLQRVETHETNIFHRRVLKNLKSHILFTFLVPTTLISEVASLKSDYSPSLSAVSQIRIFQVCIPVIFHLYRFANALLHLWLSHIWQGQGCDDKRNQCSTSQTTIAVRVFRHVMKLMSNLFLNLFFKEEVKLHYASANVNNYRGSAHALLESLIRRDEEKGGDLCNMYMV